jgi:hypothetical protein
VTAAPANSFDGADMRLAVEEFEILTPARHLALDEAIDALEPLLALGMQAAGVVLEEDAVVEEVHGVGVGPARHVTGSRPGRCGGRPLPSPGGDAGQRSEERIYGRTFFGPGAGPAVQEKRAPQRAEITT